jgi:hypothetical protein
MAVVTALRNVLAAALALVLVLAGLHLAAPRLAPHLPDAHALGAVLGLLTLLLGVVYKILDEGLSLLRIGKRAPPAYSRVVSALVGASIAALIAGAFGFVLTLALDQAQGVAKGAPAAQAFLKMVPPRTQDLRFVVELFAAFFVGSWIGRRHGRPSAGVVLGYAVIGWALAVAVEILAGLRDPGVVHAAALGLPRTAGHDLKGLLADAFTLQLPLLAGLLVVGLVGAALGGGGSGRRSAYVRRPLQLGAA